jgi:signal transduction histidine kinase
MFMESLRTSRQEAESNAALARERLERLEHEIAARRRERDWAESVLTSIGDGVIAADGDSSVTYMNDVAEQLTGWSKTEAAHQPLDRVFYTIERPPFALLSATDGRMIPVEHNVSAIRGARDSELGKVLVFRDVTERRRAQEALEESERRMHASLRAASAAAWEWNLTSDEVICSRDFLELTGAHSSKNYLDFTEWMEAVHEQDRLTLQAELISASQRGSEFRLEYRTWRDVEIRWLALMGNLARPARIVGIIVDITERRRLEEKLREAAKQESLGVLSAGIAHDFNNLLTSILGYASLLRSELPAHSQFAEYARKIEDASGRAAHLTKQMLAYSGQGRFSIEHIDMADHVRRTLEELRPSIGPNIHLELDLTAGLPLVEADPAQCGQVASNVLLNSLEAIGDRQGNIRVATYCKTIDRMEPAEDETPAGRYVVFEVRDSGPGMDDATKNKIFDPFFSTKFTGRGLGLAAVLGIVRGHGGVIRVESALGEGTLFQVFWPVEDVRAARAY